MTTKLFLDSGAYSAYQNKTSVNINDYMKYIADHHKEITTYANLDSIGSAEETWKNQRKMESCGFSPIPVYHLDEPDKYLDMCMEYDYFAVGGLASAKGRSLKPFLQKVFQKICPESNNFLPLKKVHGFGIATPEIITTFPWYSIDSTSWVQYGRYGIILVPKRKFGKITYKEPPYSVAVSSKSKALGDEKHFKNYVGEEKKQIIDYCTKKGFLIGKTLIKSVSPDYVLKENESWVDRKIKKKVEKNVSNSEMAHLEEEELPIDFKTKRKVEKIIEKGLCCSGEMRDALNLLYFLDLEKNQPEWPWPYYHQPKVLKIFQDKSDII